MITLSFRPLNPRSLSSSTRSIRCSTGCSPRSRLSSDFRNRSHSVSSASRMVVLKMDRGPGDPYLVE